MTPLQIRCAFFPHARNPEARNWAGSWGSLTRILERTYTPDPRAGVTDPKLGMPAISGATFAPPRRRKDHVRELQLLILDVDNSLLAPAPTAPPSGEQPSRPRKIAHPNPVRMEEMQAALEVRGISGYGWSTWSDRPDWPRHRVVLPLAEPIPVQFWCKGVRWALDHLGWDRTHAGLDLPATLDAARIFFLPGHPEDASLIRRFQVAGSPLRVPWQDLPDLVPTVRPGALPRSPRPGRTGGARHWAARLPVDLSTLRLADLMREMGIWVGSPTSYQQGMRWRTRCPWAYEHTDQKDDDAAYILHMPGHWPIWHCSHATHQHMGLEDLLRFAGVVR